MLADAAPTLAERAENGGTALVFGREDAGLTNDEVSRCDAVIEIPTSSESPSVNLAQSVILAAYEISRRLSTEPRADDGRTVEESFLPKEEILPIIERMDAMLLSLGYENAGDRPLRAKILDQFEKLFGRAGLTRRDAAMFEGLIGRIRSKG
jgi:tRNA/rRNA methyltransferase